MTIGQQIRLIRKSKKMTLQQVADLAQMSKQTIEQLEQRKGYPRIQTLIKLSNALNCPLRDFLDEPLHLCLPKAVPLKDIDFPCVKAAGCPFFKKK